MKNLTKKLYNKVGDMVDVITDDYALIAGVYGACATLTAAAAIKSSMDGNAKTSRLLTAFTAKWLVEGGFVAYAKYKRNNVIETTDKISKAVLAVDDTLTGSTLAAEYAKRTVGTFLGYDMVVWNDLAMVHVGVDIPEASVMVDLDDNVIIMTEKAYRNKHIETILMHEVGHIKCGHVNANADLSPIDKEIEADKYAYDQGMDLLPALREIRTIGIQQWVRYGKDVVDIKAINARIKAIKSYK